MLSSPPHRDPVLARLVATYPVFRDIQPLAVGIHKAIIAAHPDIDKAALRRTLQRHTASTRYLKVVAAGGSRTSLRNNRNRPTRISRTGFASRQNNVANSSRPRNIRPSCNNWSTSSGRNDDATECYQRHRETCPTPNALPIDDGAGTLRHGACRLFTLVGVTNSPPPPNAGSGPSNEHR